MSLPSKSLYLIEGHLHSTFESHIPEKNARRAWHITENLRLTHRDSLRPVVVGKRYGVIGTIKTCRNGLHSSPLLRNAVTYVTWSRFVHRVEVWGDTYTNTPHPNDLSSGHKWATRYRRVLWTCDLRESGVGTAFVSWVRENRPKGLVVTHDHKFPLRTLNSVNWHPFVRVAERKLIELMEAAVGQKA